MDGRYTPSRITIARMRRGLQTWQVADAAQLPRQRVWAIERRGVDDATDEELTAIADALRFPVAFFFRPHIELPVPTL